MKKKYVNHISAETQNIDPKKKKRAKNILIIAAILLVISAIAYWAMPRTTALEDSEIFDAEEVEETSEQIIQYLNEEDYESLKDLSVEEMKSVMTREKMTEAREKVGSDWGEFQSVKEIQTGALKQRGVNSAVVQMTVAYENREVVYTFAFNEDMQLATFGMQ